MKQQCPQCLSTDVIKITEQATSLPSLPSVDMPLSTVVVPLSISLCKVLKLHPAIGLVVGSALTTVIELTKPQNPSPPLLDATQFRCNNCGNVYHRFN